MPIPIPPLPPLRLFEAAARHESFTKAADELGLTASAVSHGIDSLEKWLGVELFHRRPRGVTLTPAGHHLLPYVSEALAMVALGVQRLPGRRGERRVVLSVAPTFAQRFLVPRLPRFRTLHPGIRLAIDTSHRQALFPMEGVDLSIRMGKGAWPGVKSDLLFREQLVPVATSDYLASVRRDGEINWAKVTFLRVSSLELDWAAWIEGAGAQIERGPAFRHCVARHRRRGERHGNRDRPRAADISGSHRRPAGQGRHQGDRHRNRLLAGRPRRAGDAPSHPVVPPMGARGSEGILRAERFTLTSHHPRTSIACMNRFHSCGETIHLSRRGRRTT